VANTYFIKKELFSTDIIREEDGTELNVKRKFLELRSMGKNL